MTSESYNVKREQENGAKEKGNPKTFIYMAIHWVGQSHQIAVPGIQDMIDSCS
jgi:hypothetical protein